MAEEDHPIPPIVVKKYANRRLYDTERSIYITLETLSDMVRQGRDFVVYDAKTGDDITRAVLTQIIMEEEIRGRNMLPTAFLRQLIGFYGDSMQGLVPEYLERMMEQFAQQRNQMHMTVQRFIPPGLEEVGRQNLAMMDRAMNMFSTFYRPGQDSARPEETAPDTHAAEIAALRKEVSGLRQELAHARAGLAQAELAEAELAEPVAGRASRSGIRH